MIRVRYLLALTAIPLALGGCSATTLRCGTDGESSYVELVNVPQELNTSSRYYTALCAFSHEVQNETS